MTRTAECHTDRPYLAKGLCASCYVTARQKRQRPLLTDAERERRRAYFTAYRKVWRAEHREQNQAQSRKDKARAYQQDPVKHRQRVAAVRYGISVAQYQALIAQTVCDACDRASDRTLQIDHDHDTGAIRGVLCYNCNSALGHVRDDIPRLKSLIGYLEVGRSVDLAALAPPADGPV